MYNLIKNKYLFLFVVIIFCLFVSNNLFLLYKLPLIFISFFMNLVGIKLLLILDFFILICYLFYKENFVFKIGKNKIIKKYADLIIMLIILL